MTQLKEFLGEKVIYDPHGQMIFAVKKEAHQLIGNFEISVRGWGAIQNKFKNPDGSIDAKAAAEFQDKLGQFMADAINQALEKS